MAKFISNSQLIGEKGVAAFHKYCASQDPQILFREKAKHDFGIDAEIELVRRTSERKFEVTGEILAVQIKSSESDSGYIKKETDTVIEIAVRKEDLEYWNRYKNAVLFVFYDGRNDQLYCRKINHEDKNSMLSLPLIYLTTSLEMASDFAKSVSHRKKGNPIVIEINSKILEADSIGFDWNISLKLCSQCITYQKSIEVNSIVKNIESIKNAKMIFDEPENLNIPVVWNMLEESTWLHLEKIGYQDNRNKIKKIKL